MLMTMDYPRELEDSRETVGELSDAELAAMASVDENGEDIPVYHLDLSLEDISSSLTTVEAEVEAGDDGKLEDPLKKAKKASAKDAAIEHVAPEAAGRNSF